MSDSEGDREHDYGEFDEGRPDVEIQQARKERHKFSIYGVPLEIRARDEEAYKPRVVCIGPFFHRSRNENHLKDMQYHKRQCVRELMSMSNDPIEVALQKCWAKMKELERRVRRQYSVEFPFIEPDEFVRMLIRDGCFLLHHLLRYADGAAQAKLGPIDRWPLVGRVWIWNLVRYDLLLLQNQIPFFVIKSLYKIIKPDDNKTNLVDCAISFFSNLDPLRTEKHSFYFPVDDVLHLLHLVYESVLPCPQYRMPFPKQQSSQQWIPSATELKLAGIKFKRRENARRGFLSFLDVKFSDGVMEIPRIKVSDYSISLFRNLIAFEQCYPKTKCPVTSYAVFMNLLIDTEEDVRLLHLKKILINNTSVDKDKDATHFFSRLCNEVYHLDEENYLRKLFSEVNGYHDSLLNKWRAELNRQYFKSPLTIISLIAGAIALLLSLWSNINSNLR